MPVLIVNGSHDLQASVQDARLLAAAPPSARLEIIEGMNHVLEQATANPQGNFAAYSDPHLPLDPRLLQTVAEFLGANPR